MTTEDNTMALPTREELAAALQKSELDDGTTLDRIWKLIEEKGGWDEACEVYRDRIEAAMEEYQGLGQSIDYNTEILIILSLGAGRAPQRVPFCFPPVGMVRLHHRDRRAPFFRSAGWAPACNASSFCLPCCRTVAFKRDAGLVGCSLARARQILPDVQNGARITISTAGNGMPSAHDQS
jgi:hypothetical protein